jgi:hypothetical protein
MGTRSRIAVMHNDICKSVYCHWDGYLEHNGAILQKHYDSAKANNLVALGDLSSLRPEIGEQHAFSQFELPAEERDAFVLATENWCTFYGRDRGETGTGWKVAHTFDQFLDQVEGSDAEYYYVMKDGVWYTGCPAKGSKLVVLSEALEAVTEAV